MLHSKDDTSSDELEIETPNSKNSVWLVKVPNYIHSIWVKAEPNSPVGNIKITNSPGQKPTVSLSLTEEAVKSESGFIPKDLNMLSTPLENQPYGVFYEHSGDKDKNFLSDGAKICMAGKVVESLHCQAEFAQFVEFNTRKMAAATQLTRLT